MEAGGKWLFLRSEGDDTYTWRAANGNGGTHVSAPFAALPLAVANAVDHGLDLSRDYWIVETRGRAMHYRPGKLPVNLPSGDTPD